MLQSLSDSQQDPRPESPEQNVGLEHYLAIAKRRPFHFLIPFLLALLLGSLLIAVQRPIYRAEGKILVESQDIPKDLVRPTITDSADQRIQIIKQRILTRDNLLQIVRKFGLFPREQRWMSESQLLDLMKARTELKLVDLQLPIQLLQNTIAFTLSFDYENSGIAGQVANEFLTRILNDDVINRTNRAAETTRFMEQEAKRLQGAVSAIETKITEAELKPPDPDEQVPEELKTQRDELTKLKSDLIEATAKYSSAHPEVISLKRRVAALEKVVADAPKKGAVKPHSDNGIPFLRSQLTATEVQLDDANRKLSDARLGQSLESNQESERLQVIEQPVASQTPVKPNRPKLFALVFALSAMGGLASVMIAQALDKSIHASHDLAGVVDSRLVVSIPYIVTSAEGRRKRTRMILLFGTVAIIILGALALALYLGLDLTSWSDQSWWLDRLTHLSESRSGAQPQRPLQ
jgi:capsular polysaccharide biosynthesis protein